MNPLEENHRTYRPLGRAFILKGKKEILEELELVVKGNAKDIEEYSKHKELYTKKTMEMDK